MESWKSINLDICSIYWLQVKWFMFALELVLGSKFITSWFCYPPTGALGYGLERYRTVVSINNQLIDLIGPCMAGLKAGLASVSSVITSICELPHTVMWSAPAVVSVQFNCMYTLWSMQPAVHQTSLSLVNVIYVPYGSLSSHWLLEYTFT